MQGLDESNTQQANNKTDKTKQKKKKKRKDRQKWEKRVIEIQNEYLLFYLLHFQGLIILCQFFVIRFDGFSDF